jgi:hypothetical protein
LRISSDISHVSTASSDAYRRLQGSSEHCGAHLGIDLIFLSSSTSAPFTPIFRTMAALQVQGLTPEQLAFFHENGYLLIPDALSQDTVKELLNDTNTMLNDFSLEDHPMTKFSTGGDDGADHVGDEYFLESGDKVRFFFEEGV